MTYTSSLTDDQRPLVLDTSVLINLHACTYGERILAAIPNRIIVPQIVAGELEHETSRKNGEHSFLHGLASGGTVALTDLSDQEYALFAELTSVSPSLDDGEAATIAIAATRNLVPIIDEKKGRTRATLLMHEQEPGWTLDLLLHPLIVANLGSDAASHALYLALLCGRMRIPPITTIDVIAVIGIERAMRCTCLPGYRTLIREREKNSGCPD